MGGVDKGQPDFGRFGGKWGVAAEAGSRLKPLPHEASAPAGDGDPPATGLSFVLAQPPFHVLVQDAGDQRLIGNSLG
jgi:hypothetical protein